MTDFEQRFRAQTLERPEQTPSTEFTNRVMAKIRQRQRFSLFLRFTAVAAAAVALGVFLIPSRTPESAARAWLCRTQNNDGSWAPEKFGGSQHYRAALTALSALCLDAEPHKYRTEILKVQAALQHIPDGNAQTDAYNRVLAAFALVSLVQTGRYEELKPLADEYIHALVKRQTPAGAWTYDDSPGNAALTSWAVRVLALSHNTTAAVSLKKGVRWLEKCRETDGSFCYTPASETTTPTLNAMIACAFASAGIRIPVGDFSEDNYYSRYFAAENARRTATDSAGLRSKIKTAIAKNGRLAPDNRWSSVGGDLYAAAFTLLSL